MRSSALRTIAGSLSKAPAATAEWHGIIELRGLAPGKYRVLDYENNRDLGTIDSENPKLTARFREHLLLEADRE